MPLTPFQTEVLRVLARNRSPDSFFAGGTIVNREGPRYSEDFGIFQSRVEALALAVDTDEAALRKEGLPVVWTTRITGLHRAVVRRGEHALRLDWAMESDFRFFPVLADPTFGWRLHDIDVATSKVLAAVGRQEVRDAIDLIHIDAKIMPLPAAVWAAAGKDPGLTPRLILGELERHTTWRDEDISTASTSVTIVALDIDTKLRHRIDAARRSFDELPPDDAGAVYLAPDGSPTLPIGNPAYDTALTRHVGSHGGHWPTNSALLAAMLERGS